MPCRPNWVKAFSKRVTFGFKSYRCPFQGDAGFAVQRIELEDLAKGSHSVVRLLQFSFDLPQVEEAARVIGLHRG